MKPFHSLRLQQTAVTQLCGLLAAIAVVGCSGEDPVAASGGGGGSDQATTSGGSTGATGGGNVAGGGGESATSGSSSTTTSGSGWMGDGFVVDHTSIALFDQIPESYLQAARETPMMFSDRSVGQNINEALDCLTASSWATSPSSCRRDYTDAQWNWKTFTQTDMDANAVPARITFTPDPVTYNRDNWIFEFRTGSWSELTQDFIESLAPQYLGQADVLSYQFSYLNVDSSNDIADPATGFFADNANKYDVHDLEDFFAQHPSKTFFLWTSSLARGIGTQVSTDFNNQMRAYAQQHGHVLFDVADIESHTDTGQPCYDNRDGVPYCVNGGTNCENHPDDNLQLPAICQDYTTELDGGHLGSVSAGKILIAKGFWVLMARLSGWNP